MRNRNGAQLLRSRQAIRSTARPPCRRISRAAGWALSLVVLLMACGPSGTSLAATLPTQLDGRTLTVQVMGDELSGLVTDEAVASLGKTRGDQVMATAIGEPDLLIVAIAVSGVSGEDLRTALISHWTVRGTTTSALINGKAVVTVLNSQRTTAVFYTRADTVYVVQTSSQADITATLAALP